MSQDVTTAVVVGAGATGGATAVRFARAGARVRLVTRRGLGPAHPGVERVAADATDADRLTALTEGADVLVNCAMPPYDDWPTSFPPLASALLTTAERTGAGYVMLGNVYGYGPVEGPYDAELPMAPTTVKGRVRAQMWADALAAHQAGRVRVTEVRASDFLGPAVFSPFTILVGDAVLAGQPAAYPGDLDVPHAWSYIDDVAATLVAAAGHPDAWGRAWHAPATSHVPVRELATRLAAAAGLPAPALRRMSPDEIAAAAAADSIAAEIVEMLYLLDRPMVLESAPTTEKLGVTATGLDEVLATMVAKPAA